MCAGGVPSISCPSQSRVQDCEGVPSRADVGEPQQDLRGRRGRLCRAPRHLLFDPALITRTTAWLRWSRTSRRTATTTRERAASTSTACVPSFAPCHAGACCVSVASALTAQRPRSRQLPCSSQRSCASNGRCMPSAAGSCRQGLCFGAWICVTLLRFLLTPIPLTPPPPSN
jgi:hypothetical protein